MKKVLVTGASGMLGSSIVEKFLNEGWFVYGFDKTSRLKSLSNYKEELFDLTDLELLKEKLSLINPDLIIHAAAIVNLNTCEINNELAIKLHIDSSRVLASLGAKIIYISTDSVFNGKKGDYTEESIPDPLNNYARTKLIGEYAVSANNPNHIIIRTNIFGYSLPLKGSFCEWAIKSFENKENINGFDDVIFNAIYTKHLAERIFKIVDTDLKGIINIASADYISKYQFLKYLALKFEESDERVNKTISSDFHFQIARPLNTTLNISKAQKIFSIPSIYEGIDQMYADYIKGIRDERN
jgi:dTDP-4-dehydrorhamnose reductase